MLSLQNTKILIVEDEIIIADYIFEMLQEEHFKNIKMANDKETAIIEMNTFLPDIILMDINLNGRNSGIELSKTKKDNATVIFITGQHDFVLMNEALRTNPEAYLTKPIKKVDVLAAISLAIRKKETHTFQFKDGYDTVSLDYNDIKYIMADGNYVNIQTISKRYTVRKSLSTILEMLPAKLFAQTHRSYVVNTSKVQRITATLVVIDGLEIPLSRSFSKYFK
ncbi:MULTISPECIES: LytR/AlgR family response regulator transcription factor [unclassified Lacinutrix]